VTSPVIFSNVEEIKQDEELKNHCTIGVGGKAKYFIEPTSLKNLREIIDIAKNNKLQYKIIGNGTNILPSDSGYNGLIVCTKKLNGIFFQQETVKAMAGAKIKELFDFCFQNNLGGLEKIYQIPATIGGAIKMNAGCFGGNISDFLVYVETLKDGKIIRYDKSDCDFGYRTSRFSLENEVIVGAVFKFFSAEKIGIANLAFHYNNLRKNSQPKGKTFGSIFKNPKGDFAGKLIENVGLKGKKIGGAIISNKHANFIINNKNASSEDIYNLIQLAKQKVKQKYDISLQEEIDYIGEFNDTNGGLSYTH